VLEVIETLSFSRGQGTALPEVKKRLRLAAEHGAAGRFTEMQAICREVTEATEDVALLLDTGALLSSYGFLNDARTCYERAQSLAPDDLRAAVNLANLARDAGEHAQARHLYARLLHALPDHPVVRRNALTSLEYDPEVPDAERLAQAKAWGEWATVRAGVPPRDTHLL
jgi:tetratricopeptide (TPR) repeat protein